MGIFGNKKEDENDVRWNFTKFIVNRKGEVVERFEPTTSMADVETYVKNLVENEKWDDENKMCANNDIWYNYYIVVIYLYEILD